MRKNKLKRFGYIEKINNEYVVKKIGEIKIKRNRGRGRP